MTKVQICFSEKNLILSVNVEIGFYKVTSESKKYQSFSSLIDIIYIVNFKPRNQTDLVKGGLISECFPLWFKSKKGAKSLS